MTMDPELAKQLFIEGGTLIFLDVPARTEFGIDMQCWNTGDKFQGVKMIPPGLHFIYYSAVSKDGQTAPRTGFFHNFQKREVLVKRYDRLTEDLVEAVASDEEKAEFRRRLMELDPNLGPYPYDVYKEWVSLTNHISDRVLEELRPLNNKISSASELVSDPSSDDGPTRRQKRTEEYEGLLPKMRIKPGTEIRFTQFPDKNHPDGCSAAEISKHNMDLSYTLEEMIRRYGDNPNDDFLGELQMSFVCFVVGQVYDAFEHWQQLIRLLCSCDDALVYRHPFFSRFITVLHFQLNHVPKDLFVDIVSRTNFLTTTLQVFFSNLENSEAPAELVEKGKKFSTHLTKKFKWSFQGDPDDYAPVIVET